MGSLRHAGKSASARSTATASHDAPRRPVRRMRADRRRADARRRRAAHADRADQGHRAVEQLRARSARSSTWPVPAEPLYLLKAPNSFRGPGDVIRKPPCERQGGVRRRARHRHRQDAQRRSPRREALDHVFGYTCANDVTVADILHRDASFPQWVRAKGFDTFCPMGPVVATGLDPATLVVTTRAQRRAAPGLPDQRHALSRSRGSSA